MYYSICNHLNVLMFNVYIYIYIYSITISGLRSLICRREIKNSSCEQYGTVTTSFTQYSTLRKVLVPNTSMVGYLRGLTPISAGSGLIIDPEHITRLQIKALKVQLNLHQVYFMLHICIYIYIYIYM